MPTGPAARNLHGIAGGLRTAFENKVIMVNGLYNIRIRGLILIFR
jgi:hypothetical protein